MLSGSQLRQELHNGQQQTEGYSHRQRHTAQAFAGDSFFLGPTQIVDQDCLADYLQ